MFIGRHRKNSRKPGHGSSKKRGIRVEISAGGIVYRRTSKGVRIALILDPTGKWTFAKGHVEKGETVRQAAVRETKEEMGLKRLQVVAPLGKIDFWFRDNYRPELRGMLIHKHLHYFLMEAAPDEVGHPQKEEKIRGIIWVTPQRAKIRSSHADVRPILDRAIGILLNPNKLRSTVVGDGNRVSGRTGGTNRQKVNRRNWHQKQRRNFPSNGRPGHPTDRNLSERNK